ncbi:MAG: pyridoxal-phosphate dependent enzyme [bacterium]|nr:pyridoxal-phosphate dependent enzyme [bacterium]
MISDRLARHLADHLQLAALPTPVVGCDRLSAKAGLKVELKRDDWIGDLLTGTKARVLSFILWQAIQDGVTDLVTIGEPSSNQCRLIAILGSRYGMAVHILLQDKADVGGAEPENVAIMRVWGAQIQYLSEVEWPLHGLAVKRLTRRIERAGAKALFVPFGCGGVPGALGIVNLVREIVSQNDGRWPYSHMILPSGSGTTLFALDLAFQLLRPELGTEAPALIGVSVAEPASALAARIDGLYRQTADTYGLEVERTDRLTVADEWRDMAPAAMAEELSRVVSSYSFMPDPAYVLKAFLGLEQLALSGQVDAGSRILFLVTGACRSLQILQ